MSKEFITTSAKQTQKLGELLAQELKGGQIICLFGGLGSGKTTFTQGLLKGLKVKGPYTSPTFTITKHYRLKSRNSQRDSKKENKLRVTGYELRDIYHIDAYRVTSKDILNLGWEEIIADKKNVIIVEWADRIKKIIPNPPAGGVIRIKFEWMGEGERRLVFCAKDLK